MLPTTLADIAETLGGTVHDASPDVLVTGPVMFDSRDVQPGGMLVCLPGANVDGHEFAAAAIEAGAAAVLASRPVGVPAVVVPDPALAYAELARAIASRLTATVIGITGSAGKTTTKDLLGQVLATIAPTVASIGSRNNELGLPQTVLRAEAETRFLVVEMGARHIGDIAHLTGIIRPSVGVVINVGSAHLGEFGSRENIAQAKGEMVECLPADGLAVLNADDPLVSAMVSRTNARVVFYGLSAKADVRAEDVTVDSAGRPSFTLVTAAGTARVSLQLHGAHLVTNALAAAAVALDQTQDVAKVAAALSAAVAQSSGRMQVSTRPDGVTIVNDAYNANPHSMRASLVALRDMSTQGRAVAVLGEMAELGDGAYAEHSALGDHVADVGVRWLVAVGNVNASALASAAADRGVTVNVVADKAAAFGLLAAKLRPGDVVLVKGSNAFGLQQLAADLLATRLGDAPYDLRHATVSTFLNEGVSE